MKFLYALAVFLASFILNNFVAHDQLIRSSSKQEVNKLAPNKSGLNSEMLSFASKSYSNLYLLKYNEVPFQKHKENHIQLYKCTIGFYTEN